MFIPRLPAPNPGLPGAAAHNPANGVRQQPHADRRRAQGLHIFRAIDTPPKIGVTWWYSKK